MDNKDFITVSLNLKSERIRSLKTVHKNGRLYIYISLIPEYPDCELIILLKLTNHSDYADQLFRYP